MSTTTRTLLAFLLLVIPAFYLLMDKLTDRVERQYLEAAEEPMVDAAHILAGWIEQGYKAGPIDFASWRQAFDTIRRRKFEARIYDLLKTSVDMNVYVTDASGRVLFDSRGGEAEGQDYSRYHDVLKTLLGGYGARSTRTNEDDPLSSVMYVGAPIYQDGAIQGVVSVSKPQASMLSFIIETRKRILFYGWTILLATMLGAVLVSHWLTSPVRKLTAYARAVRGGDRVTAPRVGGADIRALSTALEEMRDSLEDRKYVETYVQTLTHEMKSPVAGIRGAAELLGEDAMPPVQRRKFLGNILTETARLQSVIDRLLALSAIESMKTLEQPEKLDLAELAEGACASHQHALEAKHLRLAKQLSPGVTILGERFLVEIALGNLLQNAIDFSPVGGAIRLSMTVEPGHVQICIGDEGPGIPSYALPRVFDRFYSLQHPGTGKKSSGLGLCFVKEAAELHGGTATLENRTDGRGAKATLRLRREPGA